MTAEIVIVHLLVLALKGLTSPLVLWWAMLMQGPRWLSGRLTRWTEFPARSGPPVTRP